MVASMIPGSVVIDLAVEAGGNCPLSKMNEIVMYNGVKVVGYGNVPGSCLLYTSPSPRDLAVSRMPSSA